MLVNTLFKKIGGKMKKFYNDFLKPFAFFYNMYYNFNKYNILKGI